jgi:hypothetical protein
MSEQVLCSPLPNFRFEEVIKKHKKDKTFPEEFSIEHFQVQECSWMFRRTIDVPSILL